ncbi:endonuclease/exonuclease/phosphatase family protein [Streptomyces indicus]|uniref:Endonuclease/Exonuclease/phosphatase family protein n=1 Tax=Streptomyces indicus TaxID=417292 RepID=A0A1G9ANR2_9ACTN|nr:endonuclease/exonuclease/phosphatase family protein [Streptomyces indicus]SDK28907.1 Endonuclease/Exonuclease/phosphatase family protein [Streptomyces indicus]
MFVPRSVSAVRDTPRIEYHQGRRTAGCLPDVPDRTRIRRSVGALASALALVLTGCANGGQPADPAETLPPPAELRLADWNICGEAGGVRGQSGFCPYRDSPEKKIQQLAALVEKRHLNALTVQEVCGKDAGSHVALLEKALGSEWSVVHAVGKRPEGEARCRDGLRGDLGVAVAVRGRVIDSSARNALPPDPAGRSEQTLPVLCVRAHGWRYSVCTTHILPGETARVSTQITRVKDFVLGFASATAGRAVLTGDFNRNGHAPQLRPLAAGFVECAALRSAVTYRQWDVGEGRSVPHSLDHIYATKQPRGEDPFDRCGVESSLMDTSPNEMGQAPTGYSDHAPVWAVLPMAEVPPSGATGQRDQ